MILMTDCITGIYLLVTATIQASGRRLKPSVAVLFSAPVDRFQNLASLCAAGVRPGLNFLRAAQATSADLLFVETAHTDARCGHVTARVGVVGRYIHLAGTIHCCLEKPGVE